jgi:hypothetical protein
MHAVPEEQDTALRNSPSELSWVIRPCSDQCEPFHPSAPTDLLSTEPTAVQFLFDVHETLVRPEIRSVRRVFARRWIDHRFPFQRSASGPERSSPTAVHATGEVQEIAFSSLFDGAGAGWIDHVCPSHLATKAPDGNPIGDRRAPTAKHARLDGHETPDRTGAPKLGGTGICSTDHAEPFQRSANTLRDVATWSVSKVTVPTAVHARDDEHDTD